MKKRTIGSKGISPWLLAAMAAPLAQTASGHSWITVLITGGICLGAGALLEKVRTEGCSCSPWYCVIQWLWLAVVLGQLLHLPNACWPGYKSYMAVPLTLLVLAAWAAGKGKKEAARASNVLFWGLAAIFGAVSISGVKEIHVENLVPQLSEPVGLLVVVFLIPCIVSFMPDEEKRYINRIILGGFALLMSLLAVGVLSLPVARETALPFYEMSRSLSLLGIAERFESLVAAAMTLGYFALFALMLTVAGELVEQTKSIWRKQGIWGNAVIAGAVFVSGITIDRYALAGGCAILWILLPLFKAVCDEMEKRKKTKKSA